MEQQEDLLQNRPPQQDVDPRVQDLVPRGDADRGQQTETHRLRSASGAQNDDVDLTVYADKNILAFYYDGNKQFLNMLSLSYLTKWAPVTASNLILIVFDVQR